MRRHGERGEGHAEFGLEVRHRLVRIAVQHLEHRLGGDEAVIIAEADGRAEEEVAGFLEARQRAEFVGAAFDVGMAGLVIVDRGAVGFQHRVGLVEAGGFHVDDEFRVRIILRQVAREHQADLVGVDFFAGIVDHAAAVPVPVKAEHDIGAVLLRRERHLVQHFGIFRVRIVFREGVVEVAVHLDHFGAQRPQAIASEGARGAVAASGDDLDLPRQLCIAHDRLDVLLAQPVDAADRSAGALDKAAVHHDLLELAHLVRPERQWTVGAHLHAGPAILVVRGGDHGAAGGVQFELAPVDHRREREADIQHFAAAGDQAERERVLDRLADRAEIMAGDDRRLHAEFVEQRRHAEAERLHTGQVQFRRLGMADTIEPPAGVVLAEARGLHQRQDLEFERVGGDVGARFRQHVSLRETGWARSRRGAASCALFCSFRATGERGGLPRTSRKVQKYIIARNI